MERITSKDFDQAIQRVEQATGRRVQLMIQHPGDGVRISGWLIHEVDKPQVSVCAGVGYRDAYNQALAFARGVESAQAH